MPLFALEMQRYAELHNLTSLEGIIETQIPGVYFYRSSKGNDRTPFVYQSGIIMLAQGSKNIHIGQTPIQYGPEDYLVVGVPMPLECEAFPSNGKPLLGLTIDIEPVLLKKLVKKLESAEFQHRDKAIPNKCGLSSVTMNDEMIDTCIRLVRALCNGLEATIIGESLLEEVVYRALTGSEGHVLFDLAHQEGQYARIAKTLERVHQEYFESLTVEYLAKEASMSVSAFHNAFRTVTLESPLQYIKKVRLNKAKELIQLQGKRVGEAARMVGYASSSQFSREYKRHFNETPKGTKIQCA